MSPKISDTTEMRGLTLTEARVRLRADEMNKLPAAKCRNIPAVALEVVRELLKLIRRH